MTTSQKSQIGLACISLISIISATIIFIISNQDLKSPEFTTLNKNHCPVRNLKKRLPENNKEIFINNNKYYLVNGFFTLENNEQVIYQTPGDWWVDDFIIADSDNNGTDEINMILWKEGAYGASKPFWEKEDNTSCRQHFFVYDLDLNPVWQSSDLDNPNCEMQIKDINGDEKNELIVIEGGYNSDFVCRGKYLAYWQWQEWGFYNIWRSQPGKYSNLSSIAF